MLWKDHWNWETFSKTDEEKGQKTQTNNISSETKSSLQTLQTSKG